MHSDLSHVHINVLCSACALAQACPTVLCIHLVQIYSKLNVLTCSNHACAVSNLTSSFLCSLGSMDSSCFSIFVLAPVA